MLSRLLAERERPLVRTLQITRDLIAALIAILIAIALIQADPHHQFARAVLSAAYAWGHAALLTLFK